MTNGRLVLAAICGVAAFSVGQSLNPGQVWVAALLGTIVTVRVAHGKHVRTPEPTAVAPVINHEINSSQGDTEWQS